VGGKLWKNVGPVWEPYPFFGGRKEKCNYFRFGCSLRGVLLVGQRNTPVINVGGENNGRGDVLTTVQYGIKGTVVKKPQEGLGQKGVFKT